MTSYWDRVLNKATEQYKSNIISNINSFNNTISDLNSINIKMDDPVGQPVDTPGTHNPHQPTPWLHFFSECNKMEWCRLYKLGTTEDGGDVWQTHINDEVSSLTNYFHMIDHIHRMKSGDIMYIDISSPGGYICTATQICSAISTTKGKVITKATGMCASAGSLIWSSGHECLIEDYALFMWHMSSHMDFGCTISIRDEADYQATYVKSVLLKVAFDKGFITEEEVDRICTDPNYAKWISANEMRQRVADYKKKINEDKISEENDDE